MGTSIIEFVYSGENNINEDVTGGIPLTADFNFIAFFLLIIAGICCAFTALYLIKSKIQVGSDGLHVNKNFSNKKRPFLIGIIAICVVTCLGFVFTANKIVFADNNTELNYSVSEKIIVNVDDSSVNWDIGEIVNNEDEDIFFSEINTNLLCEEAANIVFQIKDDDQLLFEGKAGQNHEFYPIKIKAHNKLSLTYCSNINIDQAKLLCGKQVFSVSFKCQKLNVDTLEILRYPYKYKYSVGEEFDPTGLIVIAKFTDGKIFDVTDFVFIFPKTLNEPGYQFVYINYYFKDTLKFAEIPVFVEAKPLIVDGTMYYPIFNKPISGVNWYHDNSPVVVNSMADIKQKGVNGYSITKPGISFTAVRAIIEPWDTAFGDSAAIPTGVATKYIGPSMKTDEYCATLRFIKTGHESEEPSIDGVSINLINSSYNLSSDGEFYTCEADNDFYAFTWYCFSYFLPPWWTGYRPSNETISIVFAREFN